MSTNEEAVTKQPKRRKAAAKRRLKKKSASSPRQRASKGGNPRAETPIIITGGINGTTISLTFENANFIDIGVDRFGIRKFVMKSDTATIESDQILNNAGGVVMAKFTIPPASKPGCQVKVICNLP